MKVALPRGQWVNVLCFDLQGRQWSIRGGVKSIERKKKKLAELEAALVKLAPSLVFQVRGKQKKLYTFLMSSDYERNDWRETVLGLKTKCKLPIYIDNNDIFWWVSTEKSIACTLQPFFVKEVNSNFSKKIIEIQWWFCYIWLTWPVK